jgi:hypothetical protein
MSLKLSTKEKTVTTKTKVATISVKGDSAAAFYTVIDLAKEQLRQSGAPVDASVTNFIAQVDAGRAPVEPAVS